MSTTATKRARDEEVTGEGTDNHSNPSPSKRLKLGDSYEISPERALGSASEPEPLVQTPRIVEEERKSLSSSPPPPSSLPLTTDINNVPRFDEGWFDDGDIILWVENYPDKTDAALFRVHRKVLAESGVEPFRTANDFEVPPEGTPGEVFLDGVWVNKYEQQDPAEIMVTIFWIYTKPTTTKRVPTTLGVIECLLKRSRMHDNEGMRRTALEYMWNMFPSSLNYHYRIPCLIDQCYSYDPSFLYDTAMLYQVLKMADEYRLVAVLPLLYYYIANWPIDWIADGLPWSEMPGATSETQRFKLPVEHTIRILKGRDALIAARRDTVFNFIDQFSTGPKLEHPTEGCPQTEMEGGETCFEWLMRVHLYFRKQKYINKPNALEIMNTAQWEAFRKHLCDACAKRVLTHMLHGRDKVWENIPKWFGCGSWEETLEKQAEIEADLFAVIK